MVNLILITLAVVIGGGAFIFILWRKKLRYPVRVIIYEKRKDGIVRIRDKAKFTEDKLKKREYHLRKKKYKTKPIPYDFITTKNRLMLYSPRRGVFIPIHGIEDIAFIEADIVKKAGTKKGYTISDDDLYWLGNQVKEASIKYGEINWWERNLPLITVMACGIILVIMISVIFNNIIDVLNAMEKIVIKIDELIAASAACQPPPY